MTVCTDKRQVCRSFRCPRRAEVVIKNVAESPDDPVRDWFWCLGHWPLLRDMLRARGRHIAYSPEARAAIDADEARGVSARG